MTRRWIVGAAVLTVVIAAGSGLAQEAPQSATPVCKNGGVTYAAGEYACIPACHGQRRLARCDVAMPSASPQSAAWTYVSDACPSVMIINPPWPSDWNELPVVANMTPKPVNVILSAIAPEIAPKIGSHWPALIR
jgi:hypothetical protein